MVTVFLLIMKIHFSECGMCRISAGDPQKKITSAFAEFQSGAMRMRMFKKFGQINVIVDKKMIVFCAHRKIETKISE